MQGTYEAEVLGYDADFSDERQYCEHGTFIGSWWGPDYICGYCEEGVSLDDFLAMQQCVENRRIRKETRNNVFEFLCMTLPEGIPLEWWRFIGTLVRSLAP